MNETGSQNMQAFVVYDGKTGDIRHVHVEATLEGEPRRLDREELIESYVLARAEEKLDAGGLDVLELPFDELQRALGSERDLYVDTERRALAEREQREQG
jgi:hypothetical protein